MERNQIIGFALIFLILIGWSYFTQPTPEEIEAAKEEARLEKLRQEQSQAQAGDIAEVDFQENSAPAVVDSSQFGIFAKAATGKEQTYTLSNDQISISLSSKGGRIIGAELKEHFKILSQPKEEVRKELVKLFEDAKNRWNYEIQLVDRTINTQDLYFEAQQSGNKITFRAPAASGGVIEQSYALSSDGYNVDYDVKFSGLDNFLRGETPVNLEIVNFMDPIEQNRFFEKTYSTIYFKEKDDDSDYCSCRGDDSEQISDEPVEWISFVNQFFNTSVIVEDGGFASMDARVEMYEEDNPDMKKVSATMALPKDRLGSSYAMQLYLGPNEYKRLRAFDNRLEEIIPFGRSIFGSINRHLIRPFFNWLSGFIGSKGIVIIVLIFIIKMAVFPLTYKMLKSQAKMSALKPQLAGLKDKYKDDAQKIQMETMRIYREYGVSPVGGCMPMIAQIPIWYALFRFFPASITFRQEPFLWAHDLSSYDVWFNLPFTIPIIGAHLSLFTVLYAVSQLIYTYYNSKHMDMSANPAMKYVQYLMPLMFFGFFNTYASGLTCYMLFSNLITIGQTIITKNFVFDNDKILADLNVQKAKPKKKGGFQDRIAKALEQQQKIREQQVSQQKKKRK